MTPKTRTILRVTLVGAWLALTGGAASAQGFPTKPITIVVPYAPGTTDQEARALAPLLEKALGQPVQVDNRPGGGGAIGTQVVARSKPDGYTLLYAAPAVITIAPLMGNLPYAYGDLAPIAQTTANPHVLAARADAPFKTLDELIAYAKANPGKVNFGSSGAGTAVHLAGEAFASRAGITINHVPFKGLSAAITSALGGHVDIVIGLPVAILPQVEGGKMRALAQFGAQRSPVLPDVPTLQEKGVKLALGVDLGVFGPKGIPDGVVAKLNDAIKAAVASPEFQEFAKKGKVTPGFLPATAYAEAVKRDLDLYEDLVPALGLAKK